MKALYVRAVDYDVLSDTQKGDEFLVPSHGTGYADMILVRAQVSIAPHSAEREVLRKGIPSGHSIPSVSVHTEYGSVYLVPADHFYREVPEGTVLAKSALLVESMGTQVSMTIYAPGMDGTEVLRRMHKALRSEFGAGSLQLRQETHRPVSEMGLPPVLGVADGVIPKLI